MRRVTRWAAVLGALVSALALGTGGASASVAPTGFVAAPDPGASSRCLAIRGATGCYTADGDVVRAFDTEADGHHVSVTGYYVSANTQHSLPACEDFKGNGTSMTCRHPALPENTKLCLGVAVMEGSRIVRDNMRDGFQSNECFPTG